MDLLFTTYFKYMLMQRYTGEDSILISVRWLCATLYHMITEKIITNIISYSNFLEKFPFNMFKDLNYSQ